MHHVVGMGLTFVLSLLCAFAAVGWWTVLKWPEPAVAALITFVVALTALGLIYAKAARASPYFFVAMESWQYAATLTLLPDGFSFEYLVFHSKRPWRRGDVLTVAACPALRRFRADPENLYVIVAAGPSHEEKAVVLRVPRAQFPALMDTIATHAAAPGGFPRFERHLHPSLTLPTPTA